MRIKTKPTNILQCLPARHEMKPESEQCKELIRTLRPFIVLQASKLSVI